MPRLKLKGKISKEKAEKVSNSLAILLTLVVCSFFIIVIGVYEGWLSQELWVLFLSFFGLFSYLFYRMLNRTLFKRLFGCMLVCILFATPVYGISATVQDRTIAQNLQNPNEIQYFKTLLGKSYNYTELIVWENQNLIFYNKSDLQRNSDPLKIYQYGKGMCIEFAILYAELCISQGYRCRIVDNIFNDHAFNEVLLTNGTWIRVDASLNSTGSRAVGYPMFFVKEKGWGAPILSLAFENSSIVDVTSTYRNDGFDLFSPIVIVILVASFALCIIAITNFLILPINSKSKSQKVNIQSLIDNTAFQNFCYF